MNKRLIGWMIGSMVGVASSSLAAAEIPDVQLTITEQKCEPMKLNITAGAVHFIVVNQSESSRLWQLNQGEDVIAEVKNLTPNAKLDTTVDLAAGKYQMRCGPNVTGELTATAPTTEQAYVLTPNDLISIATEYKFYLIAQSQQLKKYASDWDGGMISKEFATSYYSILLLADAYQNADSIDKLGGDADDIQALMLQIEAWHSMVQKQTLTISQVIAQLQQSLAKGPVGATPWQGLLTDVTHLVDIVDPLLSKLESQAALTLKAHLIQWRKGDNPQIRQDIRSDLAHVAEQLQLAPKVIVKPAPEVSEAKPDAPKPAAMPPSSKSQK